jgi:nucleotide-binding universal stress UspA family protein
MQSGGIRVTMLEEPMELRRPSTILLPVDFSDASAAAATCAELIASRFGGKIILLHVLEPVTNPFDNLGGGAAFERTTLRDAAQQQLEEVANRDFRSIKPELRVIEGDPADRIVAFAKEVGADALVLPTRGTGAFRRFLLGSVTAKILNDLPVPVLTTAHCADTQQSCRPEIRNVLCGIALDARSADVCAAAATIASEHHAQLTILHVREGRHDGVPEERLRSIASAAGFPNAAILVENGSPHKVISSIARSTGADAVVIGRSSPSPLGRLRAESYGIIRESPVPVLSI